MREYFYSHSQFYMGAFTVSIGYIVIFGYMAHEQGSGISVHFHVSAVFQGETTFVTFWVLLDH